MLSKALEMGVCFHRVPATGEHGVMLLSFLGPLREGKKKNYLFRGISVRNLRDVKKKGHLNGQFSP
jgi:hypothetical protein